MRPRRAASAKRKQRTLPGARHGRQSQFRWSARQSPSDEEPVKPEDMSAKLAEAYARGREEGLAHGRVEASDRHAAELAAVREQAETQRQEFHINEYMEFEGAIRSRLEADREQCRRRRHAHPCAVSFGAGRKARRGRVEQG